MESIARIVSSIDPIVRFNVSGYCIKVAQQTQTSRRLSGIHHAPMFTMRPAHSRGGGQKHAVVQAPSPSESNSDRAEVWRRQ